MQSLPDVTRLSSRVVRILAENPGMMTVHGTNCYLLSGAIGPDVTLIDTGSPAPSAALFIKILANHLRSTGNVIRNIILTHHHVDHVGGLADILEYIKAKGAPEPNVHKFRTPSSDEPAGRSVIGDDELDELVQSHSSSRKGIRWLKDGDKIAQSEHDNDMPLTVMHTPGHTSDSISLYSASTGEVFVGDTILGLGSTVINDMMTCEQTDFKLLTYRSLKRYLRSDMRSLGLLQQLEASTLYPGHGPHIQGKPMVTAKIEEYIHHRLERERQITTALQGQDEGLRCSELVKMIYPDLPVRAAAAAEQSIYAHIEKLVSEGTVRRLDGDSSQPASRETKWILDLVA